MFCFVSFYCHRYTNVWKILSQLLHQIVTADIFVGEGITDDLIPDKSRLCYERDKRMGWLVREGSWWRRNWGCWRTDSEWLEDWPNGRETCCCEESAVRSFWVCSWTLQLELAVRVELGKILQSEAARNTCSDTLAGNNLQSEAVKETYSGSLL